MQSVKSFNPKLHVATWCLLVYNTLFSFSQFHITHCIPEQCCCVIMCIMLSCANTVSTLFRINYQLAIGYLTVAVLPAEKVEEMDSQSEEKHGKEGGKCVKTKSPTKQSMLDRFVACMLPLEILYTFVVVISCNCYMYL